MPLNIYNKAHQMASSFQNIQYTNKNKKIEEHPSNCLENNQDIDWDFLFRETK